MREYVNAANLVTSVTLGAGFLALLMAADGRLLEAAVLVGVAGVADALDGRTARRRGSNGRFGTNLDAVADIVAFGAVPALILHQGPLGAVPVLGTLACLAFVMAGGWRLARFPLVENRDHWVGVPIPTAGVIATVAVIVGTPAGLLLVLTVALALLMVSTVAFPSVGKVRKRLALTPRPRRARGHESRPGRPGGTVARRPRVKIPRRRRKPEPERAPARHL